MKHVMTATIFTILSLAIGPRLLGAEKPSDFDKLLIGDPVPLVHHIQYTPDQIFTLDGALRYNTTVIIPHGEKILGTPAVGDTGEWIVSVNETRTQFYIKPTQHRLKTNIDFSTDKNDYHFQIKDVSMEPAYRPTFTYAIDLTDSAMQRNSEGAPKYIPAEEHEKLKQEFEELKQQKAADAQKAKDSRGKEIVAAKVEATEELVADYEFPRDSDDNKKLFHVAGIAHNKVVTLIDVPVGSRAYAVYAMEGKKPRLVDAKYDPEKGRYTIAGVMEAGYLQYDGKHKLIFHRRSS